MGPRSRGGEGGAMAETPHRHGNARWDLGSYRHTYCIAATFKKCKN